MSLKSVLGVVAALIITVTAAQGQEGPMPADIAARLQALGRVIDPPRTAAL
ncbi:hypothetical protein [Bradyrhizobium canariense]|uniref:hypothetical protein n=1 Tax=Bradyrhizobium canariense TaxID=255045 RepID=UPI001FCD60D5|nr:hypothetical protein [Bradyrhizobium canariense]